MGYFVGGVLFGVVAVLVFDSAGSFLSRRFKFAYTKLAPVSFVLWGVAADIASRPGSNLAETILLGGLSGAIVGLVDSTAGWWISLRIGATRLNPELVSTRAVARVAFNVTIMAAGVGAVTSFVVAILGQAIRQATT